MTYLSLLLLRIIFSHRHFDFYIISIAFATVESLAIDESKCGISSAQNFSGEDRNKYESDRAKKEEMRRWVKERLSAEDYQRMCEKVENMNYAALLQTVDAMRGNIVKDYDDSPLMIKFVAFRIAAAFCICYRFP